MYADDVKKYRTISSQDDDNLLLEDDLERLAICCMCMKFALNVNRC